MVSLVEFVVQDVNGKPKGEVELWAKPSGALHESMLDENLGRLIYKGIISHEDAFNNVLNLKLSRIIFPDGKELYLKVKKKVKSKFAMDFVAEPAVAGAGVLEHEVVPVQLFAQRIVMPALNDDDHWLNNNP